MHDNTWVRALRKAGQDATLIPTYTPVRVDDENLSSSRVFLGGINLYLGYQSAIWRAVPRQLKSWLDHPRIATVHDIGSTDDNQLFIVMAFLVVALIRGGSLDRLADVSIHWKLLAIVGLLIQLFIFTPFRNEPLITSAVPQLYLLSMIILAVWVFANRHVPGILLMAAGLLMNMAAIVANGGYMPIDPEVARIAGQSRAATVDGTTIINNSMAIQSGVRLWILTDILPVPAIIPFANVFSIGDLLLTLGAGLFLYRTVRTNMPMAQEQPTTNPT